MSSQLVITKESENPLLYRIAINFKVIHRSMATPSRSEVRKKLAAQYGVDLERVIIAQMISRYGSEYTEGIARIYDTVDHAKKIESKYIIKRHMLKKGEEETQAKEPNATKETKESDNIEETEE